MQDYSFFRYFLPFPFFFFFVFGVPLSPPLPPPAFHEHHAGLATVISPKGEARSAEKEFADRGRPTHRKRNLCDAIPVPSRPVGWGGWGVAPVPGTPPGRGRQRAGGRAALRSSPRTADARGALLPAPPARRPPRSPSVLLPLGSPSEAQRAKLKARLRLTPGGYLNVCP